MKIDQNAPDSIDLVFQLPTPGTYVWQLQEGVELYENENTGKKSLRVPMKVDRPIEGDAEAVGIEASHFLPIMTPYGEKQLNILLSITGLLQEAAEKFSQEDVSVEDDRLQGWLKLNLPGKFLQATHTIGENQKGRKTINFSNFRKVNAKGGERTATPTAKQDQSEKSSW